jgi:hypothetical protein
MTGGQELGGASQHFTRSIGLSNGVKHCVRVADAGRESRAQTIADGKALDEAKHCGRARIDLLKRVVRNWSGWCMERVRGYVC